MHLCPAGHAASAGHFRPGVHISWGEREGVMSHLSAHADYRHEDYYFARTQSRAMNALEWEHSEKPLHSWSDFLYPALGAAAALLAVVEVIH
jgi:hypothetical protein